MEAILLKFLYPLPPSLFVNTMSVVSVISSANFGLSEMRGKHLEYSKFVSHAKTTEVKLSGRTGMLLAYSPSFLAGFFCLVVFSKGGLRFMLVEAAFTVHFFKRIVEVLFVHKYSGGMSLSSATMISFGYLLTTTIAIYNQHLSQGLPEPQLDLKWAGALLFLLGAFGNFYHHRLLAKLREKDNEGYKIPKGGMFNLVVCPHYLFELIAFVGISFISQTVYSFCSTIGTIMYLTGRSYATRRWYVSKFPNFPKEVKGLIPYVF